MVTALESANDLFRKKQYAKALQAYSQALIEMPEMKSFIEFSMLLTKKNMSSKNEYFIIHMLIDVHSTLRLDVEFCDFMKNYFEFLAIIEFDRVLIEIVRDFSVDKENLGANIVALGIRYSNGLGLIGCSDVISYLSFIEKNIDSYLQIYKSDYFNSRFYSKTLSEHSIDPVYHYLMYGYKECHATSAHFDGKIYWVTNVDVANHEINPLTHLLDSGLEEGRELNKHVVSAQTLNAMHNKIAREVILHRENKIDVLIPVYNGFEFLPRLIESIRRYTGREYRLLICDDCSPDSRVKDYLLTLSSAPDFEVEVYFNDENLGFIKSINLLASKCHGHFVILNSDTIVTEGWLNRIIRPIEEDSCIASVTPFTNAGTLCSFPVFMEDSGLPSGYDLNEYASVFSNLDYQIEIPTAVGFCMAINYQVYKLIGLFDEIYGLGYGEENDWSQQAKQLGFKNVIATNCFVFHDHGGSFSSQKKTAALEKNTKILVAKYPHYMQSIEKFVLSDPLMTVRSIVSLRLKQKKCGLSLLVSHDFGGGTSLYLKSFIKNHPLTAVVIPTHKSTIFSANFFIDGKPFNFQVYSTSLLELLVSLEDHVGITELVISSLAGFSPLDTVISDIVDFKKYSQVKVSYLYHDYFSVCPSYNLLDYNHKFCDVPSLTVCNKCFSVNDLVSHGLRLVGMNEKINNIVQWREMFSKVNSICDNFIFFSESSMNISSKAYVVNDHKIIPHVVDYVSKAFPDIADDAINIAIFGNITESKGRSVLIGILSEIVTSKAPVNVHVFGRLLPGIAGFDDNLFFHGAYSNVDFSAIIEKYKISGIIVPSIWPETFSYVTEEAILCDVVVACFDIGAPAERIRNYSWGLLWDINGNFNYLLCSLLEKIQQYKSHAQEIIKDIEIYQIYYDISQRKLISDDATPYFNSSQPIGINLHETDVFIKNVSRIKDGQIVGFVSWKFESKSAVNISKIKTIITENKNHDAYFINPFFELPYLFDNVWVQAENYHPGLTMLAKKLYIASGYEWDLSLPMNEAETLYCNYWFGNKDFWEYYVSILNRIIETVSSMPSSDARDYFSGVGYHTGANALTFILERTFSTALVNKMFNRFSLYSICYTEEMKINTIRACREAIGN